MAAVSSAALRNRLKFRQLALLAELEVAGSLHRAAERLGMSQPAAAPQAELGGGGLGGLIGSLTGLGGGGLLDNAVSDQPTDVSKGNDILGQIFGSKDRSREVAADAATQSGVEPSLLKKMLPILAMIAAGYVMKQAGQGGGLGGALGGILGGNQPANAGAAAGGQGGILDDLIGAAGKFLGR